MEFAELVIVFAVTITLSNIASRILPMIPAPLIQIFPWSGIRSDRGGQSVDFEPELFLVMIIAPLLFREGEKADISSILKNFGTILFLAFGGVILTLCRRRCDVVIPVAKCPSCCLLCFWSSVRSDRCGSSQFAFWTGEYSLRKPCIF